MDEAQQADAAAPLSDQPSAADQPAAPAAPVAHPPMPLWMEVDEDASSEAQLLEMRDPGGQERWGSEPLSSIRSPAAAAAAAPSGTSAKRPREETNLDDGDEATSARDERDWMRRQRVQGGPAAAAAPSRSSAAADSQPAATAAASAADITPLCFELPSWTEPDPLVSPLSTHILPRDWFIDLVPDELICCVCTEVARDPPNLEVCGHAVCRDCLVQHRRPSSTCPLCRQSFAHSKLASQPFAQSMVWRLRVRCVQHDKGCGWKGQLGTDWCELKAHDAVCQFKTATCSFCNESHQLKDTADHRGICSQRPVMCASCAQVFRINDMPHHQPAMRSVASIDLTGDHEQLGLSAASASSASSTAAAPGSTSSAPTDEMPAAGDIAPLLPPLVPPCNDCEVCPRGCEDPQQLGRVFVYRVQMRRLHERVCPQQPVTCTLCDPVHLIRPRQLPAHVRALLASSQNSEYAQQQVAQLLLLRPTSVDTAWAPFVATQQAAVDGAPPPTVNFGCRLREGDLCDCLDIITSIHQWVLGEVIGVDATHLLIHFVGWYRSRDEWIPKGSPRIQPPRSRTQGYTGPPHKRPAQ